MDTNVDGHIPNGMRPTPDDAKAMLYSVRHRRIKGLTSEKGKRWNWLGARIGDGGPPMTKEDGNARLPVWVNGDVGYNLLKRENAEFHWQSPTSSPEFVCL